jgi:hypothetical protein
VFWLGSSIVWPSSIVLTWLFDCLTFFDVAFWLDSLWLLPPLTWLCGFWLSLNSLVCWAFCLLALNFCIDLLWLDFLRLRRPLWHNRTNKKRGRYHIYIYIFLHTHTLLIMTWLLAGLTFLDLTMWLDSHWLHPCAKPCALWLLASTLTFDLIFYILFVFFDFTLFDFTFFVQTLFLLWPHLTWLSLALTFIDLVHVLLYLLHWLSLTWFRHIYVYRRWLSSAAFTFRDFFFPMSTWCCSTFSLIILTTSHDHFSSKRRRYRQLTVANKKLSDAQLASCCIAVFLC